MIQFIKLIFKIQCYLFVECKIFTRELLCVFACNGPFFGIAKHILSLYNWRPVEFATLDDDFRGVVVKLSESSSCIVERPRWFGREFFSITSFFPPIKAYIFNDAIVNAYTSAILQVDKLFVSKRFLENRQRYVISFSNWIRHGRKYLVAKSGNSVRVKNGIFIGGAGASNWYHFICECLPKVVLIKSLPPEFCGFPLLVPEECRVIPSFGAALDLFSCGHPVYYMTGDMHYHVENLVVIDELNVGPFNLSKGSWPSIYDYTYHYDSMQLYINQLRSFLNITRDPVPNQRRIYIMRKKGIRDYNQEELIEISREYGFEPILLESLSLYEQAQTFSQASHVVGPSGSAWVGMIFRINALNGLSWLPPLYDEFCCYSGLAAMLGHNIQFIEARINKKLKSTMDAHSAKYDVCPILFEKVLKEICETK